MCGITGMLNARLDSPESALKEMIRAIGHRGPDDSGVWADRAAGVGLAHARLSILDLSPLGHQPMASSSGRYMISFNGEIYNFEALRADLESAGRRFRGRSDTEVLLAGAEQWGAKGALERLNGMFSFALWDKEERVLTLARDRLGEKPLYYGRFNGVFLFGSELKALRRHPAFRGEIEREALSLYLRLGYVPAPYSIYKGVHKLPAAHYLQVRTDGTSDGPKPYWSLIAVAEAAAGKPKISDPAEAMDQLDALLAKSVRLRMASDVPLGAFLSGGIDSSLVVAHMQRQSARPVRTFTIGFKEPGYNEAEHAKSVAAHLKTDHTELYVDPPQAQAVIPRLAEIFDEPFADSSQIPTLLVSELTRRHVTVSLSGDGGDELFGGYTRYLMIPRLWSRFGWTPLWMRRLLSGALKTPGSDRWESLGGLVSLVSPYAARGRIGDQVRKASEVLVQPTLEALHSRALSIWANPEDVLAGEGANPSIMEDPAFRLSAGSYAEKMMAMDGLVYLPDDLLVKVDRATMSVSLESRAPFLDHELVEWSWRVPMDLKIRGGETKWLLKQVLYRHVPRALVDRPKMGFGVPVERWLRGPLRDWAESLLDERRLKDEGYFDPAPIRRRWKEHLEGRNRHFEIWTILMFEDWLRRWR